MADIICYENFVLNLGTVQAAAAAVSLQRPNSATQTVRVGMYVLMAGQSIATLRRWESRARRFKNCVANFRGSRSVTNGIFNL
jgi:hypothetical protein